MSSDRNESGLQRHRLQEELRSLSFGPIMRGTVVERLRRCGRPNCRCARDAAARHGGKFLTVSLEGRTQAIHVRPEDEQDVKEAIAAYGKLWDIINRLTACEMADLKRRARERRRARQRRQA
jgi:hypothetical protein